MIKLSTFLQRIDRKKNPSCLVEHMNHLSPRMRDIFPGVFYAEHGGSVIQASLKTDYGPDDLTKVNVGILECTDEWEMNRLLATEDVRVWLKETADEVPQLLDLGKKKILDPESFQWSGAPGGKGSALFLSHVDKIIYSFECHPWITSVCNAAARFSFYIGENPAPTYTGKQLASVLVADYYNLPNPNSSDELSAIQNIDIPKGNKILTKPEDCINETSLKELRAFVTRNEYKFRKLDNATSASVSLLGCMTASCGIPEWFRKRTESDPALRIDFVIDTLQDKIAAAYLKDSCLHVVGFANGKDNDLMGIISETFKYPHFSLSYI